MRLILISLILCGCAERTLAPNPTLQNKTVNYTKDSDLKVIKESDVQILSKAYKPTKNYVLNKDKNETDRIKLSIADYNKDTSKKFKSEPEPSKYSTHQEWVKTMTKPHTTKDIKENSILTFKHTKQLKK
jgi:hypothetical protein